MTIPVHNTKRITGFPFLRFALIALLALVGSTLRQSAQATGQQDADANLEASKDWTVTLVGNGWTKGGYPFSITTYKGSTGAVVQVSVIHCGSHDLATKEYETRVDTATKVIEKVQATDKDGNSRRAKAVILVTTSDKKTSAKIVSVVGSDVLQISSDSLQEARSFDRHRVAQPDITFHLY